MAFTTAVRLLPLPPHAPSLHHHRPTRALLPKPTTLPRLSPASLLLLPPPSSLDVSKDDKADKPTSDQQEYREGQAEEEEATANFDKRRLEERFVVLNTGVYECGSCGFRYDQAVGDPSYPIPPGLGFENLPEDWRCPTCGAAQSFFVRKSVEIAGFAQNQQFGLGGNTLTSGQKALLIYGSLLFFFALFLSGYFLQ